MDADGASGTLTDSTDPRRHDSAAGVRRAAWSRDTAHVKATGSVRRLRSGGCQRQAGDEGHGRRPLDVDATVANVSSGVTPDSVQAERERRRSSHRRSAAWRSRARRSTADYHDSTGDIRTLDIVGPRRERAGQRHAGAERHRAVEPEAPRRQPTSRRSASCSNQPLAGIAKVDATVTGNRRELQATGNVTGNGLKYGDNGALTSRATSRRGCRTSTVADANVDATTHATFVTRRRPEHQRARREDDLRREAGRVRRDGEAAAAVARRRRLADRCIPTIRRSTCRRSACTSQGVQWQLAPGAERDDPVRRRRRSR